MILIFLVAIFSISTICANKNQNKSKKIINTKYELEDTPEQMAAFQAKAIMETPLTEYIGNTEIGQSKYDKEITNLDQTLDLNKTRKDLKASSEDAQAKGIIFIVITFIVGFFIFKKVTSKQ